MNSIDGRFDNVLVGGSNDNEVEEPLDGNTFIDGDDAAAVNDACDGTNAKA